MRKIYYAALLGLFILSSLISAQTPGKKEKLYSQMSEDEKNRFIAAKSDVILSLFGRTPGDEISQPGLDAIRRKLDFYILRMKRPVRGSCNSNDNWASRDLISVLKRGNRYADVISEEFSAQNLPPQFGIYLAMIESEFCPASQSPTGPIGLFRFTTAVGQEYGLNTVRGATEAKPDERFDPRLSARAAAKYMRKMIDNDFGNDAVGFPLAIAAYGSGEQPIKKYIAETAATSKAPHISFWVLRDARAEKSTTAGDDEQNSDWLAEKFQKVSMFFAAAIIGEHPQTFGIDLPPLSQTKK